MRWFNWPLLALNFLGLTACYGGPSKEETKVTQADADKALCVDSERKDLINPETMAAFDFRPLQAGDPGFNSKPSVLEPLGTKRLRQYYFRYKADSQVGLKVTAQKRCDINEVQKDKHRYCGCIDWNIAVLASQ